MKFLNSLFKSKKEKNAKASKKKDKKSSFKNQIKKSLKSIKAKKFKKAIIKKIKSIIKSLNPIAIFNFIKSKFIRTEVEVATA